MTSKNVAERPVPDAPAVLARTRVLLVDDHEIIRVGLAQLLANEPRVTVCAEAADAPTALRLLRAENPDMAIIDLSLREGNGLELIKQIKATHPDVRVIVLSMHDEEMFAARALRAGALGYVSKHAPAKTIISAIHAVLAGQMFLSDRVANRLLSDVARKDRRRSPIETLSDRELDIFRRIGEGQSPEEIALQLHLSPKTVSTYRDRIRAKLDLDSAATLARHACLWVHENGQG